MNAVITFDLNKDREDWELHCQARKFYSAIWQYQQELRNMIKYCHEGDCLTKVEGVEWAQLKLFEMLEEKGVSLDVLS
mgnify:CR=1 FL=1